MESYVFILFYGIFCPWLIFFSIMFYKALISDESFILIIFHKKQLFRYWFLILIMLLFPLYIFFIRLYRMGISIDVLWLKHQIINWLLDQTLIFLFQISILLVFCIIFSYFFMKWLKLQFRKYVLALYLYYSQYPLFQHHSKIYGKITQSVDCYLLFRVRILTKSKYYQSIAFNIWPLFFFSLTRKIFTVIVPYVCVFDYLTQNGVLTKMFVLLPWCYLYFLRKATVKLYIQFRNQNNKNFINYETKYYKNFINKSYRKEILYLYYVKMLSLNNNKFKN